MNPERARWDSSQEKSPIQTIEGGPEGEKRSLLVQIDEDKHDVVAISLTCAIFKLQHIHGWAADDEN